MDTAICAAISLAALTCLIMSRPHNARDILTDATLFLAGLATAAAPLLITR